ncbi:MAG: iron ABC transporter permease [Sphaerochaetaceae bacterium]|nr:iron ABC transporter permease [Sphaerochaetaceae bacterium]
MTVSKKQYCTILIVSVLVMALLVVLSIAMGSVTFSFKEVLLAILGKGSSPNRVYIIRNIRIPRVIGAIFSGIALALGGLIFQCVFQNSMADSFILGISSGASAAVGLGIVLNIIIKGAFGTSAFAFFGGTITTILLFSISKKNPRSLLLTGIALNFLLSAITSLCIYIGKGQGESILLWTMGSLSSITWRQVIVIAISSLMTLALLVNKTEAMNLLLLDDSTSISSGLNVKTLRIVLLLIGSLSSSVVVAYCGIIGFIGLMAPHFGRLIVGPDNKKLLPLSAVFGADILLVSDLLSRTIAAPSELPIGIITSIIGAPLFLLLLKKNETKEARL